MGHFFVVEKVHGLRWRKIELLGFQRAWVVFLSWRGEVRRAGIPGKMMDREAGRGARGNFSCPYSQYTRKAQQAGGDAMRGPCPFA
jgi:hypothetical protein